MTDLSELLERVKATTGPDREIDGLLAIAFAPEGEERAELGEATKLYGKYWYRHQYGEGSQLSPHFTSSIDAALALVERCLPGWKWNVGHDANDELHVTVWHGVTERDEYAATAPLSILAAFLSALQSQAGK